VYSYLVQFLFMWILSRDTTVADGGKK